MNDLKDLLTFGHNAESYVLAPTCQRMNRWSAFPLVRS